MKDNILKKKSYLFALRIVKLSQYLVQLPRVHAVEADFTIWHLDWREH